MIHNFSRVTKEAFPIFFFVVLLKQLYRRTIVTWPRWMTLLILSLRHIFKFNDTIYRCVRKETSSSISLMLFCCVKAFSFFIWQQWNIFFFLFLFLFRHRHHGDELCNVLHNDWSTRKKRREEERRKEVRRIKEMPFCRCLLQINEIQMLDIIIFWTCRGKKNCWTENWSYCQKLLCTSQEQSSFPQFPFFFWHISLKGEISCMLYLPYCIVLTILRFLIGSGFGRTSSSSITTDDTLLESFADAAFIVFSTFPWSTK